VFFETFLLWHRSRWHTGSSPGAATLHRLAELGERFTLPLGGVPRRPRSGRRPVAYVFGRVAGPAAVALLPGPVPAVGTTRIRRAGVAIATVALLRSSC
jgi:hypothetical protein